MPENKLKIGIIGAGISGLVAGRNLQRKGYAVTIFEARDRTGGRIQSLMVVGHVVEAGPEFIHGNLKETLALLKEYDIQYDMIDGKMYQVKDKHFNEMQEMTEGWDDLLKKMKALDGDLPFGEFLNKSFPGDKFAELRKSAIRYAEGFDLADTETASTMALAAEWDHEESEQYRIAKGYGTLITALETDFKSLGGEVLLNHAVDEVVTNPKGVMVLVAGEKNLHFEKLIITIPLGLLKGTGANRKESSSPDLKKKLSILDEGSSDLRENTSDLKETLSVLEERQNAFDKIGYGTVIKIVMIWRTSFWEKKIPDAQFILSDHVIPTWWTQHPQDIPMLTGWIGGPKAEAMSDQPDSFFLDNAIDTLADIFSLSPAEIKKDLKEFMVFNWKNEPWSRGAYTYSKPGYQLAKQSLRKPVGGRIYLTGEAYYDGPYPGTVEAAIVDGLRTANEIISFI